VRKNASRWTGCTTELTEDCLRTLFAPPRLSPKRRIASVLWKKDVRAVGQVGESRLNSEEGTLAEPLSRENVTGKPLAFSKPTVTSFQTESGSALPVSPKRSQSWLKFSLNLPIGADRGRLGADWGPIGADWGRLNSAKFWAHFEHFFVPKHFFSFERFAHCILSSL